MSVHPCHPPRKLVLALTALVLAVLSAAADEPKQPQLPPALTKAAPENLEDLKAIQEQVKKVLEKVQPATVGVRIDKSFGSGVIVSKDGYVLTAGHVSGAPGRDCTLILPNGKSVKAKTLGAYRGIDSGMMKIVEEGDWPFVEMGNSAELQRGQWCIASGHPTGYKPGRTPVVRLGRLVDFSRSVLHTDCTLVGGDSGGPLFDMNGKVIGIHSRIGGPIAANMHVPVDTYRETWDSLANCANEPSLGVMRDLRSKDYKISRVSPGAAAEQGGLKVGDVIVHFDGQKLQDADDLLALIARKKPGDEVSVEVRRGDETVNLKLAPGKR